MGKKQVPTASELREYLAKERAYLVDCVKNNKTFVITGPKFPGETIWKSKITLPLLEAAEEVGTSNEEIWELCRKRTQTTHAPVTLKEYQRMLPFAQKEKTVDAVLKLLETYIPPFDDKYWTGIALLLFHCPIIEKKIVKNSYGRPLTNSLNTILGWRTSQFC